MLFSEYGHLGAVVVEIPHTTDGILLALAHLDENSAVSETPYGIRILCDRPIELAPRIAAILHEMPCNYLSIIILVNQKELGYLEPT
jgi:hypothetical protein